jgi:spoIIIJ-associated protein
MSQTPKELLEQIVGSLGFQATVDERPWEQGILLDVQTDDASRLIGRKGQTLSALQYLLNRILFRHDENAPKVTIDVGSYRSEQREELIDMAKKAAEKCRKWGEVIELRPMNAFNRRIVHNALKDDPDVETTSVEVDGSELKVILLRPRSGKARG